MYNFYENDNVHVQYIHCNLTDYIDDQNITFKMDSTLYDDGVHDTQLLCSFIE